jgi:hypothetical protein
MNKSSGYLNDVLIIIKQHINEIRYLRAYILTITFLMVLIWSLQLSINNNIAIALGKEDGFWEWATAISFLITSIIFFLSFLKSKTIFFLLFSIMFFIGFGEEISWSQRIFNFALPDSLKKINVSQEFNVHNIEVFNSMDFQKLNKRGLERLLEIEFLFKMFTLVYCVVLPFFVCQVSSISRLTVKIKLPIPPISLGLFFIMNYLVYKISNLVLVHGIEMLNNDYFSSFVETFELMESIIFLVISFYFYNLRDTILPGKDVKQLSHS